MARIKKINENGLTAAEQDVFDCIVDAQRQMGYPPSVREIADTVGLKSTSSVQAYINTLEEKGFLRRDPAKPRALEILKEIPSRETVQVPVIGDVAAGMPILAQQEVDGYMALPADDFHTEGTYMLRVHGDSMINVGICDGDQVVIEPAATAEDGEIVVALVDDSATIKRFYKEDGQYRLQPENDAMEPIIVKQVEIQGIVVGLVRSFKRL